MTHPTCCVDLPSSSSLSPSLPLPFFLVKCPLLSFSPPLVSLSYISFFSLLFLLLFLLSTLFLQRSRLSLLYSLFSNLQFISFLCSSSSSSCLCFFIFFLFSPLSSSYVISLFLHISPSPFLWYSFFLLYFFIFHSSLIASLSSVLPNPFSRLLPPFSGFFSAYFHLLTFYSLSSFCCPLLHCLIFLLLLFSPLPPVPRSSQSLSLLPPPLLPHLLLLSPPLSNAFPSS